ncbi:MAG: glycoside hydrolase family 65 protein [Candidatus Omnitrophica bacterium]|nr:glycoside hydrolase family 65 protein [Candidatus Omnitrophota bacterium]
MEEHYRSYCEDDFWLIRETVWAPSLQNIRESQFTLGNGYFATRGVLEEIPYDAMPGTYIAGIYDGIGSQVKELVNFPNPFNFRFTVNGEKIGLGAMRNVFHKRILNTKKALLVRHTLFENVRRERFDYQSIRFVSLNNKNLGVMQIIFTPLDKNCLLDVYTGIDTSVFNVGTVTEGRKKHFKVKEAGQFKNAGYLAVVTLEKKYVVIYWAGFYYEVDGKKIFASDNVFQFELKKNQTVKFTKIFFIKHFPYREDIHLYKERTFIRFSQAFHTDFNKLITKHIKKWEGVWKKVDIIIEGTANLQQNLRFNLYHLLISAPQDKGFSSVGARTLSGEGYRGHIFWDTELFVMPFYLYTFPQIAKNILLYRYRRLSKARELAKREGYQGAKFPWESADTGEEETPAWARDFDGSIIKIQTHLYEHHITADIAYAFYKYYLATGDEKFLKKYACEIIFETARFWTSRVFYNKITKRYEIRGIIGPDEFHINVNNNAYTNGLAQWNLSLAYTLFSYLKKRTPSTLFRLTKKLDLTEKEVKDWIKIAKKLKPNIDKKNKVIEQFDGYFKLKDIELKNTDENGIPLLPKPIKPKDLKYTKLIKQADVLMLLYLLGDRFSFSVVRANYDYYIKRTLHKSSLSAPIHAIMAVKCEDMHRAYNFFNVSLRTDISNLYGNTREGIHAASLGGTWQAVVFGFCGIEFKNGIISVTPKFPRTWQKVKLSLTYRGDKVEFNLTNEEARVKIVSKKKKKMKVVVFGKSYSILTNKKYKFLKKGLKKEEYYY